VEEEDYMLGIVDLVQRAAGIAGWSDVGGGVANSDETINHVLEIGKVGNSLLVRVIGDI
jgi:hypothetical protein